MAHYSQAMIQYLVRRLFYMVISACALSIVAFIIIQLPPGDYVTKFVFQLRQLGLVVDEAMMRTLYERFAFDRPLHEQYLKWIGNIVLRGDFGESMAFNKPVSELLSERFLLSVTISISTLIITYVIAVPIGIYSATHPYSVGDYTVTVFGFIGVSTPNFLLALILMFVTLRLFGWSPGGLFSREYLAAPWSVGRVLDLMTHLPVPLIVIGTAGTAWLIRVLRSSLSDELSKQYVITARAKGVGERRILFKYPVRIAVNPIISAASGLLPGIVSGEALVAIVLSLPTIGPLLLTGLLQQDMFLASSVVLILGLLIMVGTLISDFMLVLVDPRIRFEQKN